MAERLEVDEIVGTSFIKKHIHAIFCWEQKFKFTKCTVPIVFHGNRNTVILPTPRTGFKSSEWIEARTPYVKEENGKRSQVSKAESEWMVLRSVFKRRKSNGNVTDTCHRHHKRQRIDRN